jgi:signal peptidase II
MWAFGLAGLILALDQATKSLVQSTMVRNQSIEVAGQLLRITYIHNPSAAFGISLFSVDFHIVFSAAAAVAVGIYIVRLPRGEYWPRIALAGILAGALGNMIDRLRLGEVVDFIQVGLSERVVWPIFNVADMGVSVGVTLLLLYYLVVGDPPPEEQALQDDLQRN